MLVSDFTPEEHSWCEVCRKHQPGKCDDCGYTFAANIKYHSQSYHLHEAAIGGVIGTRAVQKELCVNCYLADHKAVYPKIEVPDLPPLDTDPKFYFAVRQANKIAAIEAAIKRVKNAKEADLFRELLRVGSRFL